MSCKFFIDQAAFNNWNRFYGCMFWLYKGPCQWTKALKESCRNIQWLSLNVLDCQDGGPLDQQGTVTFEARWRDRDRREGVLRECSRFGRGESGEWLYLEALSLGDGLAG